jgi:hypothetical protein
VPHHPSPSYLAYLLTADPYYYRTQLAASSACWLLATSLGGDDTEREWGVQERGIGWCVRTISQMAAIAVSGDAIAAEYKDLLAFNISTWASDSLSESLGKPGIGYPGMNTSGMFYSYGFGGGTAYGDGAISNFMFDFWFTGMASAEELHVFTGTDATNLDTVVNWMGMAVVGILGGDGDGFCYTQAYTYTVTIGPSNDNDPLTWYSDWADIYTATDPGGWPDYDDCGTTLGRTFHFKLG